MARGWNCTCSLYLAKAQKPLSRFLEDKPEGLTSAASSCTLTGSTTLGAEELAVDVALGPATSKDTALSPDEALNPVTEACAILSKI